MNFNNLQLYIDLKTQDRLRQWFSLRENPDNIQIKAVEFGDSDVDYALSTTPNNIRTLNAPYQVDRIKWKLIYSGSIAGGLAGNLTMFLRHVNSSGQVESLYNYPPTLTYTLGVVPPTLYNGNIFTNIAFNTGITVREGFIAFFQTLPQGYTDPVTLLPLRYKEEYSLIVNCPSLSSVTSLPSGWELIPDVVNGSFLLAKPDSYVFTSNTGTITVKGLDTGISETISFNY